MLNRGSYDPMVRQNALNCEWSGRAVKQQNVACRAICIQSDENLLGGKMQHRVNGDLNSSSRQPARVQEAEENVAWCQTNLWPTGSYDPRLRPFSGGNNHIITISVAREREKPSTMRSVCWERFVLKLYRENPPYPRHYHGGEHGREMSN